MGFVSFVIEGLKLVFQKTFTNPQSPTTYCEPMSGMYHRWHGLQTHRVWWLNPRWFGKDEPWHWHENVKPPCLSLAPDLQCSATVWWKQRWQLWLPVDEIHYRSIKYQDPPERGAERVGENFRARGPGEKNPWTCGKKSCMFQEWLVHDSICSSQEVGQVQFKPRLNVFTTTRIRFTTTCFYGLHVVAMLRWRPASEIICQQEEKNSASTKKGCSSPTWASASRQKPKRPCPKTWTLRSAHGESQVWMQRRNGATPCWSAAINQWSCGTADHWPQCCWLLCCHWLSVMLWITLLQMVLYGALHHVIGFVHCFAAGDSRACHFERRKWCFGSLRSLHNARLGNGCIHDFSFAVEVLVWTPLF